MATVNKRVGLPHGVTINGIDAGGKMTARIDEGYDTLIRSAPDGLGPPIIDREAQYCRGTIATQDWVHVVELLLGVLGTYVFYERKAGTAEATGYIKHTITNPVIHRAALRLNQGRYMELTFDFECRAADETKGFADMHKIEDNQPAPAAYIASARGGFRVQSLKHGADLVWQDIYHTTGFDFTITMPLVKACNDSDVGYTCVDARISGITAAGSITFQDSTIDTGNLVSQVLLAAARNNLVLTAAQSMNAAAKVLTIAGVIFTPASGSSDVNKDFTDYSLNFEVANDPALPLTLDGTNKILAIA